MAGVSYVPPRVAAAGVRPHHVSYWRKRGWLRIRATPERQGRRRTWPDEEQQVAVLIRRLADAGIRDHVAAYAARRIADGHESNRVQLGPGIHITIGDAP